MPITGTRIAAPFGAITLHRLVAAIEAAPDRLRRWRRARATAAALAGLSDHELADIGLTRGQIDAVAASLAARH